MQDGQEMLAVLKADPRASRQALLLAHLYADTDAQSLATLRQALLPLRYTAVQLGVTAGVTASAVAGGHAGVPWELKRAHVAGCLCHES